MAAILSRPQCVKSPVCLTFITIASHPPVTTFTAVPPFLVETQGIVSTGIGYTGVNPWNGDRDSKNLHDTINFIWKYW